MGLALSEPDADGSSMLYVTDRSLDAVVMIAIKRNEGALLEITPAGRLGKRGKAPGLFREPLGVCVCAQRLLVSEGKGARLQVLTLQGAPLLVLPSPGAGRLCGITCSAGSRPGLWHVHVAEMAANRLHSFTMLTGDPETGEEAEEVLQAKVNVRKAPPPEPKPMRGSWLAAAMMSPDYF